MMSLKRQESSSNERGLDKVPGGCQFDILKALEERLMIYSG